MKFAHRLRQLARAFVDAQSVVPTIADGPKLADKLGMVGLIPHVIAEPRPEGGMQNRLALVSERLDWQLLLRATSFDLAALPTDAGGTNLADIESFARNAAVALSVAAEHFGRVPHRLALAQEGMLGEMSPEKLDTIRTLLVRMPEGLSNNPPFEWDWRIVTHVEVPIAGDDEEFNVIVTVKRLSGILSVPGGPDSAFDQIRVEFDVNTSPGNSKARFGPERMKAFFETAAKKHKSCSDQIAKHILGGA